MTEHMRCNLRKLFLIATIWLAVGVSVYGQSQNATETPPSYEVVSIKPNKSGPGMMRVMANGDRFSATNISLRGLIQYAYNIRMQEQVSGLSGWADSAAYDIEAKTDEEESATLKKLSPEAKTEQGRLIMQAMLADRFKLKVHRETKEMPVFALVIAKSGFKLKEADPNDTYPNGMKGPDGIGHAGAMMIDRGKLTAQGIPMSALANNLTFQVHRIVVDKTGLTGKYDFTLQWSPDEVHGADAPESAGPSIFTALQEQLGLKLEQSKGPVDTVVVDHVEMPSDN
jgi:uncharacterized protein (TIGR03435 family)